MTGSLAYGSAATQYAAFGLAVDAMAACVWLSLMPFAPDERQVAEALLALPLLGAALAGERAIGMSRTQATLARRAVDEGRALTLILDDARRALQSALADAESHRAQVVAQSSELDAVLQALPDALVVYAADGSVVRANEPARALYAQLTGASLSPADSCDLERALHSAAEPPAMEAPASGRAQRQNPIIAQSLRGEAVAAHFAVPSIVDRANLRHFIAHAAPIITSLGQISGAVLVATDVTMVYALEQHKEEFLSVASHELRTPLTTLKLTHRVLGRQLRDTDAASQKSMQRMDVAIRRLERLVNDLFDSSRIQSGDFAIRLASCDLAELCQQVVDEHRASTNREIVLQVEAESVLIEGDADRLAQVLANLLSNAVKYSSPASPVMVYLSLEGAYARVSVQDAGVGISADLRERVFDRYFRVPEAEIVQGSGVGLGLGLFIARNIIERHRGAMGVESAPGVGSTFWFELARQRSAASAADLI